MKKLLITLICSSGLTLAATGQVPSASPITTPATTAPIVAPATTAPAVTPAPAPSVTPDESDSSTLANRIHSKIDKRLNLKHSKGLHINVDGDDDSDRSGGSDQIPKDVFPLVAVVMLIVFGTPVAVVAVIMYFGFSRNRMMHKTVRMMVEKGQPVPAALLNPPPHERKRSDVRRGVVMMMIGIGLVVFLGSVNNWEDGTWSIGVIPLLIGLGYLLVWKLEPKAPPVEPKADNPPPLP